MRHIREYNVFVNEARGGSTPEEEAARYFDETAIRQAKEKESEPMAFMPISDFLAVCNAGGNEQKYARVNGLLGSGTKFNEIPYLMFTHDNNGNAKVIGHEGRHRAKALMELGVQTIPVLMKSFTGGEGFYTINKENLAERPPYFEEEFPVLLRGELDNAHNRVPFPIKL
jgi:hypothetical protein